MESSSSVLTCDNEKRPPGDILSRIFVFLFLEKPLAKTIGWRNRKAFVDGPSFWRRSRLCPGNDLEEMVISVFFRAQGRAITIFSCLRCQHSLRFFTKSTLVIPLLLSTS